jgi:hypothetical protein
MALSAQRSDLLVQRERFYTILIRHFERVEGFRESRAVRWAAGATVIGFGLFTIDSESLVGNPVLQVTPLARSRAQLSGFCS